MTDQSPIGDNTTKDPDEWVTGDEAMTGSQASYLRTAQASKRIDELQEKTGRGRRD